MSNNNWKPTATIQDLKARAEIIKQIRQFFWEKNFLEVETPILSQYSVTDVNLSTFKTEYIAPSYNQSQSLYMITSPEYHMKRLLASGSGDIFQICKVFRNEEAGFKHNPEFTMLEWYRNNFSMLDLIYELDELLQFILNSKKLEILSYQEAFMQYVGFDPLSASKEQLINRSTTEGLYNSASCDYDTLLEFLFASIVEKNIGKKRPIAIYNFPTSQAALAKINIDDNRVAERFEIYFKGIELANGFAELIDAKDQEKRFIQDNKSRKKLGLDVLEIDYNFINALQSGMNECAGVAVGLDRLIMIALDKENIKQTVSFVIDNA